MSNEMKTQWHPAFCAALMLELAQDREVLDYQKEYPLNTKPIMVDLLVIKKNSNMILQNEIGKLFKGHNLIEYKSPHDDMGIDRYFKTNGYACLYKAAADKDDAIKAEDITITMVREAKPEKMLEWFREQKGIIEKRYQGIYYIRKVGFFDTQILVTRELSGENHIWLKALTDRLSEQEARRLLSTAGKLHTKEEAEYADSVLQVSAKANRAVFDRLKEEEDMCEALMELMKPEIDREVEKRVAQELEQGRAQGIEQGRAQGIEQGRAQGIVQGRAQGIEQGRAQGIVQGKVEGIIAMIEACWELGISKEVVLDKVISKFELDKATAEEYVEKHWK